MSRVSSKKRKKSKSTTKEEAEKKWTAHFCVTDQDDNTLDVYISINDATKETWSHADLKHVEFEEGCCGQNRCVVCAGTMRSAELISIHPGAFPFAQHGNIHESLLNEINDYLEKKKDEKDNKETEKQVHMPNLRFSSAVWEGMRRASEEDVRQRIQATIDLMSQPAAVRKTISAKHLQDAFKVGSLALASSASSSFSTSSASSSFSTSSASSSSSTSSSSSSVLPSNTCSS
jgi:hypothetical protein